MNNRNYQLDFLRAFAIIQVLIIHSITRYSESTTEVMISDWFQTFSRPCIAIFLFVSGYLYNLDKENSEYLLHKLKRIISPYLFFSIFAIPYTILILHNKFDLFTMIYNVVTGNTLGIYYYVFVIVAIFITAYLLNKIPFVKKHPFAVFIAAFLVNIIYNFFYFKLINNPQLDPSLIEYISVRLPLVWLVFFYMGIVTRQYNLQSYIKKYKNIVRIIWAAIFVVYNIMWYYQLGNIHGYLSVIGTLFSFMTILFLITLTVKPNKTILFLSTHSYTIYLSHIFFVYFLMGIETILHLDFPFYFNIVSFTISLAGAFIVCKLGKISFKEKSYYTIGS